MRNRLVRLRQLTIHLESRGSACWGEVAEIRARRGEIERFIDRMPTSDEDFASMDGAVMSR